MIYTSEDRIRRITPNDAGSPGNGAMAPNGVQMQGLCTGNDSSEIGSIAVTQDLTFAACTTGYIWEPRTRSTGPTGPNALAIVARWSTQGW